MNGTAISVKDLLYRVLLAKRLKNRTPQGWMIPMPSALISKKPRPPQDYSLE